MRKGKSVPSLAGLLPPFHSRRIILKLLISYIAWLGLELKGTTGH